MPQVGWLGDAWYIACWVMLGDARYIATRAQAAPGEDPPVQHQGVMAACAGLRRRAAGPVLRVLCCRCDDWVVHGVVRGGAR